MLIEQDRFEDHAALMKGVNLRTPLLPLLADPTPRRGLLIGSCMTNYVLRKDLWCESDLLLFNGGELQDLGPLLPAYDFVFIQVPLRAILRDGELWNARFTQPQDHQQAFGTAVQRLRQHLQTCLRQTGHKPVFVGNFLVPVLNPLGRLMPRHDLRNLAHFVERLNQSLGTLLDELAPGQAHLVDLDAIAATVGKRFLSDEFYNALNHAGPPVPDFGHELDPDESRSQRFDPVPAAHRHWDMRDSGLFGQMVSNELRAMLHTLTHTTRIKLVVVDLDNTLWRGVASEDADRLEAGVPERVNRAFFQNFGVDDGSLYRLTDGYGYPIAEALHYCRSRGLMLAILSKNNHDETVRNIERIYAGKIQLDNFVSVQINWEPKPDNMRRLLQQLNLLPGNVLFIDDNPLERQQMDAAFPEMVVMGRWIRYVKHTLHHSLLTEVAEISADSAARSERVRQTLAHADEQAQVMGTAGLQGLQIRAQVQEIPADAANPQLRRAVELLNKTNQFNLNGIRLDMTAMLDAMAKGCRLFGLSAQDRFTEHGQVGFALVNPQGIVVQWAISCRVLGLKLECFFLNQVLVLTGSERLVLHYLATDKNFPLKAWLLGLFGGVQAVPMVTRHLLGGQLDHVSPVPAAAAELEQTLAQVA